MNLSIVEDLPPALSPIAIGAHADAASSVSPPSPPVASAPAPSSPTCKRKLEAPSALPAGAPAPLAPSPPQLSVRSDNVLDHYSFGRKLGEGSFACVYQVTSLATHKLFACKALNRSRGSGAREAVSLEVELASLLNDCPLVARIVEIFDHERSTRVYVVMELCAGGELYDRIEQMTRIPENEAKQIFEQVLSAVSECHMRRVVHLDLKPENFVFKFAPAYGVRRNEVRLVDFGLAVRLPGAGEPPLPPIAFVGSPGYVAPELCGAVAVSPTPAADAWSLGVLLFVMVKGHLPFHPDPENPKHAVSAFAQALAADITIVTQYLEDVSPAVSELILSLLTVDPLARITVDAARRHEWLNEEQVQAGGKKMRSVSVVEP